MSKKHIFTVITLGLLVVNGVRSNNQNKDIEDFDINSIVVEEEEEEIYLGFNTADYLPKDFNPYAFPSSVEGFDIIDENDIFELGFDPKDYLPANFDPFKKVKE